MTGLLDELRENVNETQGVRNMAEGLKLLRSTRHRPGLCHGPHGTLFKKSVIKKSVRRVHQKPSKYR